MRMNDSRTPLFLLCLLASGGIAGAVDGFLVNLAIGIGIIPAIASFALIGLAISLAVGVVLILSSRWHVVLLLSPLLGFASMAGIALLIEPSRLGMGRGSPWGLLSPDLEWWARLGVPSVLVLAAVHNYVRKLRHVSYQLSLILAGAYFIAGALSSAFASVDLSVVVRTNDGGGRWVYWNGLWVQGLLLGAVNGMAHGVGMFCHRQAIKARGT